MTIQEANYILATLDRFDWEYQFASCFSIQSKVMERALFTKFRNRVADACTAKCLETQISEREHIDE